MGKVVGSSWKGSSIYISFNKNKDFRNPASTQEWTTPQLLLDKPGYILWYPSLQPMNTPEDIKEKRTCLKIGKRARLFVKKMKPNDDEYAYVYIIEFD